MRRREPILNHRGNLDFVGKVEAGQQDWLGLRGTESCFELNMIGWTTRNN